MTTMKKACHGHPVVASASHPEEGTGESSERPPVGTDVVFAHPAVGIGGSSAERPPVGMVEFFVRCSWTKLRVLMIAGVLMRMRFLQNHFVEMTEWVF